MSAIEVKHLTKEYQLGALTTLKDNALNLVKRIQGKPVEQRKRFKALDDINFTIEKGEVVGLIGTNGAGKSTLLKHLARITTPTSGEVIVNGTVAPLIEVGAGFVPDLTGRENIYLNCSIMGMSRKQTNAKIDEIIEFAELEEFIDTPVKRYSSGMGVRLGFSIATSIDADILIVDEVLAVGDLAFQRKCFERMEEIITRKGKTVLLVSHNIRQVERLCSRAIFLNHGKVVADDEPTKVANLFYKHSNDKILSEHKKQAKTNITSTGEVDLLSIDVVTEDGSAISEIAPGDPLHIKATLRFNTPVKNPEVIIGTHRTDFVYLTASSTLSSEQPLETYNGVHTFEYIIPTFPLVTGVYGIRLAIFDINRRAIFGGETLKTFSVSPLPTEASEPPARSLNIPAEWIIDGHSTKQSQERLQHLRRDR